MRNKGLLFTMLIAVAVVTTSCQEGIYGDGPIVSEDYNLPIFSSVELEMQGKVYITPGDYQQVELLTNSNLLNYIDVEMYGEELRLSFRDGFYPRSYDVLEFRITTPYVDKVTVRGSGDIFTTGLFNPKTFVASVRGSGNININQLDNISTTLSIHGSGDIVINDVLTNSVFAEISGSGNIYTSGSTRDQEITINGSGDIDNGRLYSKWTDVLMNGSGDCTIYVEDFLKARINGSGDVYVNGPATIDQAINGSGDVFVRN